MNPRARLAIVAGLILLAPVALGSASEDTSLQAGALSEANVTEAPNATITVTDILADPEAPTPEDALLALDAPPGLGADDPWVDANGDEMFGALDMGPNALRLNERNLAATSDGTLQYDGDPVCLQQAENCEQASFTGAMPIQVDGETILLSDEGCQAGEIWTWDGSDWACEPDEDTTYDGTDFALSDQSCASGDVVAAVDADGNIACVEDQDTDSDTLAELGCAADEITRWDGSAWTCSSDEDTTYTAGDGLALDGTTFALVQACTDSQLLKYDGTAWVCSSDQDTTYDGTDFALSDQSCASGDVVAGVDADGTVACVEDEQASSIDWSSVTDKPAGFADGVDNDTTYDGTDFALSSQACNSGDVVAGVDAGGSLVCVEDQNSDADTLAQLDCASDEITRWDGSAWTCSSDEDTTYDGSDFALSSQSCGFGQLASGIDTSGSLTCRTDEDTTYTAGEGLMLSGNTFEADTFYLQKRIDGSCGNDEAIAGVNQDGSVNCEPTWTLDGDLWIGNGSFTSDDALHFDRGAEQLVWNNADKVFNLSDDLYIDGEAAADTLAINPHESEFSSDLTFADPDASTIPQLRYVVSSDRFAFEGAGDLDVEMPLTTDGPLTVNAGAEFDDDLWIGESSSSDDDTLYFDRGNDHLRWNNFEDRFEISNDLHFSTNAIQRLTSESSLFIEPGTNFDVNSANNVELAAERELRSYADTDDDSSFQYFEWYVNDASRFNADQVMELQQDGDLRIGGELSTNSFDLAESYRQAEPVEAGQLVSVDAQDPTAVRKADAADDTVLGIVSTDPGLLLGGASWTLEEMEDVWGPEAVDAYQAQRDELRSAVLDEHPGLAEELASDEPEDAEMTLTKRMLETFAEDYLAPVALAGRVPTQVAATNGPIAPGDPLTASPEPGVAEKADAGEAIVGKALESLEQGTGTIEVFVSPGWHAGTQAPATAAEGEAAAADVEQRMDELETENDQLAQENQKLREQLDAIEQRLDALEE